MHVQDMTQSLARREHGAFVPDIFSHCLQEIVQNVHRDRGGFLVKKSSVRDFHLDTIHVVDYVMLLRYFELLFLYDCIVQFKLVVVGVMLVDVLCQVR
jgi:hypothetical protein